MWPLPTESKTKEVPLTEVAATAKGLHFDKEYETNCYFPSCWGKSRNSKHIFQLNWDKIQAFCFSPSPCNAAKTSYLRILIGLIQTFLGVTVGSNASPVLPSPHYLWLGVAPCLASQVHLESKKLKMERIWTTKTLSILSADITLLR